MRPGLSLCPLVVLAAGCRDEAPALPVLVARPTSLEARTIEDRGAEARAALLALRSMTGEDRLWLADQLDALATRLEARSSLLGTDLGEGDPEVAVRKLTARCLPALTAARALARGRWQTRGWAVTLAARCPADGRSRCIDLSALSNSPDDRLIRFAAWPVTRARFMSQADVVGKSWSSRVGQLRTRTTRSASAIALVLVANDLQRGRDAREARIVAAATRLARVLARDGRSEMGFMAQWSAPIEGASLVPHLDLRERLMIVPRLGALARLPAFEAEIGAVLEQGQ